MVDKRPSDRVASDAGRVLRKHESTKIEKELAASIEANREPKKPDSNAFARQREVFRVLRATGAKKKP